MFIRTGTIAGENWLRLVVDFAASADSAHVSLDVFCAFSGILRQAQNDNNKISPGVFGLVMQDEMVCY